MKILLEPGLWLGNGEEDPVLTSTEDDAKEFTNIKEAHEALSKAREYRPFLNAEIVEDFL